MSPGLPRLITIDGPVASGKSRVGFQIARQWGFVFFDTGLLFRLVCWKALRRGPSWREAGMFSAMAESLELTLRPPTDAEAAGGRTTTVWTEGRDVTERLRDQAVDRLLPRVSAMPRVRAALTERMRAIGQAYLEGQADGDGVIMAGRDIGTVVFPQAPCKLYFDADPRIRAQRRQGELRDMGVVRDLESILTDLLDRDRVDSTRRLAPTRVPDGAMIFDTTHMTLSEVIDLVQTRIQAEYG